MKEDEKYFRKCFYWLLTASLRFASRSQGLDSLRLNLERIVPDISDQYSSFKINDDFYKLKVRNVHAFQISLVNKILENIRNPVIVDIGDSSGTHLRYIVGLYYKNRKIRCLSVNMDPEAVERIRSKGFEAVQARAEDLQNYDINADVFLCYETLEHIMDPCTFLHTLSSRTKAQFLIVTVPYLSKSRIGLHHIRQGRKQDVNAENTHIFELCPDDWDLIVKHSGWSIVERSLYLQYPKWNVLWLTRYLWKKYDFLGFYGLILKRDNFWSLYYKDWRETS